MRLCILLPGLSATFACASTLQAPQDFVYPVDVEPTPIPAEPEPPAPPEPPEPPVAYVPAETWSQGQVDDRVRDVVYTEPGELPRFEHAGAALPLRSTAVRAHLRGPVAEVVVTQRFVNEQRRAIEAVYTFPLPENSAVDRMRMVLGARVIEAEIHERGQAQRVYRDARDAGHTAALLEQERPNVFTQSVANIPPGEAIDVEIRYLQTLSYDAGEYEFVFPTVVGPRYIPGAATGARSGSGRVADTDRVPDASRITPPTVGHGQRTGNDLTIEVVAEAGSPISAWAAPAHDVLALATGERLHIKLAPHDRIPNRDFVLRYRSAGPRPAARMFVAPDRDGDGGHFLLVAEPPRLDVDKLVGQRELLFVVDVSGSMNGAPLALAKAAMHAALAGVRPVDTFDVLVFSGATARLFAAPRPATAVNLALARQFVDGLGAGGGTAVDSAVQAALAGPVGEGRHRYVFFMTDGYTGEEDQIARSARQLVERQRRSGARARVFGVGLGGSPNTHLLAELSRAGDGVPLAIHRPLEVARAVQTFERIIDAPILTDVSVQWDTSIKTDAVYPVTAPDLFASRPLVIHGRYAGMLPQRPALALRGAVGPQTVTVPISVTPADERTDVLAGLWARARVDELELTRTTDEDPDARARAAKDILTTGLEHHLVTAFTSLVAVDRSRTVTPGATVVQPTELPEGVDPALYGSNQMHNVPVGGTSRDFTAVVEVAPTATHDTAGIRLAGTTGAESRYITERNDDAVTESIPHVITRARRDEWRAPTIAINHRPPEPYARTRIHHVTAATPAAATDLQTHLARVLPAVDRCFEQAERPDQRIRRRLELRLRITADHDLADLVLRTPGPLSADLQKCIHAAIAPEVRAAALPPGDVTLDLRVWMRF